MTSPRMIAISTLIAAFTLMAAPAFAHDAIEVEFNSQQARIEQGIRTRQLTFREAALLRGEQDKIATMIARARRDGHIDSYERREIERAQAVASRHIYAEKHDAEVAPAQQPRRWGWWNRIDDRDGSVRRWW